MNDTAASGRSGVVKVLIGTVVAAASSFIVLLVVAPALGPAGYATFSVYWAALFMIVAVLFGVQQESTRAVAATRGAGDQADGAGGSFESAGSDAAAQTAPPQPRVSVITFALWIGAALLVLIAATSPLWAAPLFGSGTDSWGLPLAIAVGSYALVAATNGVLAGTGHWGAFALLAVIDGVLRLALVAVVLLAGLGETALAWAVAIPFPVSLAIVFFGNRAAIAGGARVNGTLGSLTRNTSRTLTASVASAILINGFPVFLSLFGRSDQATLGAVILAVTLTRAPILVPLTALQSMLIARFSSAREGSAKLLVVVVAGLAAFTALIAGFVWLWGGPLLNGFFGEGFVLAPATLAGLVAASGCLGILTATGAATLAAERHTSFAAGWMIAAALALGVLAFAPLDLELRVVLALAVGPLIGSAWHAAAYVRATR